MECANCDRTIETVVQARVHEMCTGHHVRSAIRPRAYVLTYDDRWS